MQVGWTRSTGKILSSSLSRNLSLCLRRNHNNVFESGDYTDTTPKLHGPARSHSLNLRSLVEGGDFRMAEAVREQLISSGKPITPDKIYVEAARNEMLNSPSYEIPFENWLRLCPSKAENEAGESIFKDLIGLMKEYPNQRLPCIHKFGMIVGSKGYVELVQKEILPLVWEFGGEERLRMTDEIRYEMLPKKLPDTIEQEEGVSLFEDDENAEYLVSSLSQGDGTFLGIVGHLHEAVKDGKYAEAKMLVQELHSVHYRIPEHMVFEQAAQMALRVNESIEEVVSDFTLFFSLVPPLHLHPVTYHTSKPFMRTMTAILHRPFVQSEVLQAFSLILSSKGYASLVSSLVLPPILRYSQLEESKRFLRDYEELNTKYLRERAEEGDQNRSTQRLPLDTGLLISFRAIREPAIRAFADAGYLDAALDLLPSKASPDVKITQYTYSRLLHRMRQKLSTISELKVRRKLQAKMEDVQQRHDSLALLRGGLSTKRDEAALVAQMNSSSVSRPDAAVPDFEDIAGKDVVHTIRQVKAAFPFYRPGIENRSLPLPATLIDLITQLSSESSRPHLLALLRQRALSSTYPAASLWLFSEMVFLWRNAEYAKVVELYERWFWCVGVPREEVLNLVHFTTLEHFESDTKRPEGKLKLYPTKAHIALVWQSLAMLATTKPKLVRLYKKLVAFGKGTSGLNGDGDSLDASWAAPSSDADPVLTSILNKQAASKSTVAIGRSLPLVGLGFTHPGSPYFYSPSQKRSTSTSTSEVTLDEVDSCPVPLEAFTPFIRLLSRKEKDATIAATVLRDMLSIGLQPSIHHFTELATVYAAKREKGRALRLLAGLETANPVGESPSSTGGNRLPAPDFIMYVAIMRAFISARDMEGVRKVDGRMRDRFGEDTVERWKEDNEFLRGVYRDWETCEKRKN
ncbi:hypothetical protein Moror_15380 [Moniliophthora roreri MCA 2997]|uniref:Pentatricopeptide repeat protein n=1 Tax=Moniliophthora roreri (strain MCA 2997) TaxID=1381753 RepID=V2X5Q5_MONRO|nr:hypothetical protein Moror_15380 [Moniliophthora roreri MCA 2997]